MYKRKQWELRSCVKCGVEYKPKIGYQKYCSRKCSATKYNGKFPGLATATVGAIGELEVCADLLKKGFSVFRAVSASCSCDLAVLKDHQLIRVEVTTGYRNPAKDRMYYPKKDTSKFDVLAVSLPDGIYYSPSLDRALGKPHVRAADFAAGAI